jgi:hypothetical protein
MASLLPTTWEVPAEFRSRLGERAGRQRIMVADGHLLIILYKPPQPGEPERDAVFFWRNPKGELRSTERGSGIGALTAHFESWRETVDRFDDQMDGTPTARKFFSVVQCEWRRQQGAKWAVEKWITVFQQRSPSFVRFQERRE